MASRGALPGKQVEDSVLLVGKLHLNQLRAQARRRQLIYKVMRPGFEAIKPQVREDDWPLEHTLTRESCARSHSLAVGHPVLCELSDTHLEMAVPFVNVHLQMLELPIQAAPFGKAAQGVSVLRRVGWRGTPLGTHAER